MDIEVQCFATLAGHTPPGKRMTVVEGVTLGELLPMLDLREEDVKIMFVNGKHVSLDTAVTAGDRVGIFPAVGGG
ncbi:MAG TPA: MoaD/ThiS family protein [Desulfomicrobiaceae bacterium]|nr:MoaD/ThiS family protein [Desulfomicrobiaceae bacterium]